MNGLTVQDLAVGVAEELPAASSDFPFGPETQVFRVGGKIFMMTTDATGEPLTSLKCDPQDSIALRQQYPSIITGYHLNKKHWISIGGHPSITKDLVEELVVDAYHLVVRNLPKAQRPHVTDRLR